MSDVSIKSNSTSAEPSSQTLRTLQIAVILVATMLHAVFLSKAKPLQSANDRSRWCTIWSLVERGTFQIDEIRQRPGWDTIDLVHVDGHFYSTKPPLLTSVIAGMTWCIQRATGWNLDRNLQSVTYLVLLLTNIFPFLISLLLWIRILDRLAERPWTRFFGVLIAAFATLTTPFLMVLNNHTVATASATIAIYAACEVMYDSQKRSCRWMLVLCGLACGWTMVNELPAAALGFFLCLLCYRSSPRDTIRYFLPAIALPIVALIAANVIATGSWKPTYADYGSDKYRFVIDGVPSYWMNPQGVDRNLDSWWVYVLHCTVGHHGLFSLTPISLLAIGGWLSFGVIRDRTRQSLLATSGLICVIVIAFYATRTQNYNYGGVSCGLRWAVWLTPLWILATLPVLDRLSLTTTGRGFALLLALGSIYSAWQPIDNPWRQPWLFAWMESRGWIDYSEEREHLSRPLWSWFDQLPDTEGNQAAWVEFEVAQPNSATKRVRLTSQPRANKTPAGVVEIEIRESFSDGSIPARTRTIQLDKKRFDAGAPPGEFMRWTDPNVTPETQQSDMAFVRGLPRKVSFEQRSTRYVKTSLRKEAVRCKLCTAHVAYSATEEATPDVYRCLTWLSDDVPFGVIQVEFHVNQLEDASVLFHERWTIRDCFPKIRPYEKP